MARCRSRSPNAERGPRRPGSPRPGCHGGLEPSSDGGSHSHGAAHARSAHVRSVRSRSVHCRQGPGRWRRYIQALVTRCLAGDDAGLRSRERGHPAGTGAGPCARQHAPTAMRSTSHDARRRLLPCGPLRRPPRCPRRNRPSAAAARKAVVPAALVSGAAFGGDGPRDARHWVGPARARALEPARWDRQAKGGGAQDTRTMNVHRVRRGSRRSGDRPRSPPAGHRAEYGQSGSSVFGDLASCPWSGALIYRPGSRLARGRRIWVRLSTASAVNLCKLPQTKKSLRRYRLTSRRSTRTSSVS